MKFSMIAATGLMALAMSQGAQAAGDADKGKTLFIQCRACHTVDAGAPNTIGPNLSGIVGSKAATQVKYVYSPMMAKSGLVWTTANLDKFLTRPSAVVPGTKMAFGGVAAPKSREDIIAYLATLKGPTR